MATTTVQHTYRLKGGNQQAVERNNPFLDRREPIVVFMNDGSTKMKIGDGEHYYNDLQFIGEQQVFSGKTRIDFPNVGKEDVVYKAEKEAMLYHWNTEKLIYEVLGPSGGSSNVDFDTISGGTAKDLIL